jgi:TRAP-type C4-dicarboxylate transport system permease small subunit
VGFLGAAIAVRKNTHIYIELVYHFLPTGAAKGLAALVDLLRTAFLVIATYLAWQVTAQMGGQRMSGDALPDELHLRRRRARLRPHGDPLDPGRLDQLARGLRPRRPPPHARLGRPET